MNITEIYETDLWKKLSKNQAFSNKFYEIIRRTNFYLKEEDILVSIEGNKLIISYDTPIQNRDDYSQEINKTIFEISIDQDDNLLFDEKSITICSDTGYDFDECMGGEVYTRYSSSLYDPDGIELTVQLYTDKSHLDKYYIKRHMDDLDSVLNGLYNPSLVYFNNIFGMYPKASVLGDNPQYIRRVRSKDNLGIVDSITCSFRDDATPVDIKHEYYFNTFRAHKYTFQPEVISIIPGSPFAIIDEHNILHISRNYSYMNLTIDNYKKVARENLLEELRNDQEYLSTVDVKAKYELMINKLENEDKKLKRSR